MWTRWFTRLQQLAGLGLVISERLAAHAQAWLLLTGCAMMLGATGLQLMIRGAAALLGAIGSEVEGKDGADDGHA